MTFQYNDAAHPGAITDVLVAGRQARLQYDAAGRLSAITDAAGMTSRFGYAGSDIVAMDTPYGHTAFASGGDMNGNLWVQATQIVDGIPAKERVELRVDVLADNPAVPGGVPPAQEPAGNVPAGMNLRNAELDRRNSFYWDRRAMAEMGNPESNGVFNYDLARVTHWMYDAERGILYDTPSSVKAPLEGRVWFEYGEANAVPDQFTAGTLEWQATAIGRVLDGAGTLGERSQVRRYAYNGKGRVVQSVDPKGRETSYAYFVTPNGVPISPREGELLEGISQRTGDELRRSAGGLCRARCGWDRRHGG